MMRLSDALPLRKGEVVSFVGAGGKTTAMYRLGRELVSTSWRVITTTTTMIRPPVLASRETLVVDADAARALSRAEEAIRHSHLLTLTAQHLEAENKLRGIPPDWVAPLAKMADAVLVEADGARGHSLKAPAAYEPVIPAETSWLVPVVGIDAVGRPLSTETVHRPELVAALTGLGPGEAVTASAVAKLLLHAQGGLKGAPPKAHVAPLINKVQDEAMLATARQIAAQIKSAQAIDRVMIAAVALDDPVVECWRRVSAVVLAAGAARRLGRPKQLLPVADSTMLERVLRTVMDTSTEEVIVVLGHAAAEIAPHVPASCRTVLNPDWEAGISSSIRSGLEAVDPRAEAVLFVLADQPLLTSVALERLLLAYYGTTKAIVAPVHEGQQGAPALFDRRLFAALRALQGDVGGRQVIKQFPHEVLPVELEADLFLDIDTAADYERLLKEDQGIE